MDEDKDIRIYSDKDRLSISQTNKDNLKGKISMIFEAILLKLLGVDNYQSILSKNIEEKFSKIPNTDYLSIWLQRITITYNKNRDFNSVVCKKIYDDKSKIWNSNWINIDINEKLIIKQEIINKLTPVISSKNLEIFDEYNW